MIPQVSIQKNPPKNKKKMENKMGKRIFFMCQNYFVKDDNKVKFSLFNMLIRPLTETIDTNLPKPGFPCAKPQIFDRP